MTNKTNATYVFGFGRSNVINNKSTFPKDFFYGYFDLKDDISNVNYIEFETDIGKSIFNNLLTFASKVLRKLTKLSFFLENICTFKNFQILRNTKNIILTNDRIGLSLLPFLIIFRLFNMNKSTVVVMGLLAKETNTFITHFLQRLFLNLFFSVVNNFMFLSKGEYQQANISYYKYRDKFHFAPFCIDTNFWTKNNPAVNKKKILFIGNDGRREYDLVLKIAESLTEYEFTLITSNIDYKKIKSENIELIKGHWNKQLISDEELRKIYSDASLSIIPIRNSYQPSGQSVALQSMSMGVPVMITYTDGFWDKDIFDKQNIIFVEKNILSIWKKEIDKIMKDDKRKKIIANNASKVVYSNYRSEIFYNKLKSILFFD